MIQQALQQIVNLQRGNPRCQDDSKVFPGDYTHFSLDSVKTNPWRKLQRLPMAVMAALGTFQAHSAVPLQEIPLRTLRNFFL